MNDSTDPAAGVDDNVASAARDLGRLRTELAAIVESSDEAIVGKTLEGIVTSWNAGAERLFGYSAHEMIGEPILRLIPTELQHEETRILSEIRAGRRVERYETRRRRKSGELVEVSLIVSPVRDSSGRIVGASKIAHDISGRRAAEKIRAEHAHTLEVLNQVGRAVVSETTLERIVQVVTDAATELSGAQFGAFFYNVTKEKQDSYWLYTLSGVDRAAFAKFPMPRATHVFGPTFRGEGIVRSADIRQDPRYGRNVPYSGMPPGHLPVCSYLAVSVVARSGEVIGGLFFGHSEPGVFTERSEHVVAGIASQAAIAIENARLIDRLREREAELEKVALEREQFLASERTARAAAERLSHIKDEFLATLSHELRTPLNAIQGWASLLRQRDVSEEDRARGMETIERNVRAQTQIVNDLLDMSSIISGKLHLEVQALQIQEVIRGAIEAIRPSAEGKRIRLLQIIDSGIGTVRGDPNRLQQVLWNLLSNAVKFTPAGGRIQVVLERVNSHVEIVIEDSGIGIAPEFLPFVFERFRQADPSTTRNFGGLGLGLSIVKNLIELHGGSVRVKSPGKGHGSTFIVALPISHVHPQSAQRAESLTSDPLEAIELPRLDGVRVLIVDDEPDGRALLARILEGRGAQATCASGAHEALQYLQAQRFDVLLSDIGMPEVDGYTLIRQARALKETQSALIAVAITAYARAEDRQRSLLAGYQMHLTKPIEAAELVAGIASLLGVTREG